MNKKRIDLNLYPDTKFKGILYQPDEHRADEEEIPPMNRKAQAPWWKKVIHSAFAEGAPQALPRTGVFKPRKKTASRKKKNVFTGSRESIFKDKLVRGVLLCCAAVVVVSSVAIEAAFARPTVPVTLHDNGRVMEADTTARTVEEFLVDNNVTLGPDDVLDNDLLDPVTGGMEIIIRRAMPVTVATKESEIEVSMVSGTVEDALALAGVEVDESDEVYPVLTAYVRSGMEIDHIHVDADITTEIQPIPFKEVYVENSDIEKGQQEISRPGEPGEMEIVSEQVYKNDILTSDKVISETVIKEPVEQIVQLGTWVPVIMPDGGKAKFTMQMEVTAYCSQCNTGNKTAIGTYPSGGYTVAAKNNKLPYGTSIYVPGFGYGRVEDTGGFPSHVIDVYLGERSSCTCGQEWGRKYLTVYVIG
ncbi:MAG: G5 domain-containing protein [Christensenellaceae bacterium]